MSTIQSTKVKELVEKYQLVAHPEGGYFRETYRSDLTITSPVIDDGKNKQRNTVTQIYFLLGEGDVSRFHKVAHEEIWHFYEGAPLRLLDLDKDGCQDIQLGSESGRYHHVIKGGNYQAAESTGEYTLVGCTVAPGFDFVDFAFLSDQTEDLEGLDKFLTEYKKFI